MLNIICPPETKCKDCDIMGCTKNMKYQNIFARKDGKSKTTLINYINNCTEISQELKIEMLNIINESY